MTAPSWLRRGETADWARWQHGWTTVEGPDFGTPPDTPAHAAAAARLAAAVGLSGAAWARQVHGGTVVQARGAGFHGEADAVWTTRPGLGVVGRGADCPLVLVAGRGTDGVPACGFAHASWRSTVRGITARLLAAMTAAGLDPDSASALICPAAGPCCYEVGDDVRHAAEAGLGAAAARFFLAHGDRWRFDLWRANAAQLEQAGLSTSRIAVTGVCTICGGSEYPSFRRQGARARRLGAIVGAPPHDLHVPTVLPAHPV